jgi:uncharacterized membrane protein
MQNPPPNPQGYGNQYGAPQGGGGPQGKSSLGLDANIAAALGYIVGILAIILFFTEKENRFVRFHAIQSVIYAVAMVVLVIVLSIVSTIITVVFASIDSSLAFIGMLFYLLILVIWLGFFVGLILAAVKAYQGQLFKLPIVGNMAEKIANKP